MIRTRGVTLEELGHGSSLEVDLSYRFYPGEPIVWRYADGSGYPGCPPEAEFVGARVTRWDVNDDERLRGTSWLWEVLDVIATRIISDDWDRFCEGCLEHAAELMSERDDDGD